MNDFVKLEFKKLNLIFKKLYSIKNEKKKKERTHFPVDIF